MLIWIIDEEWDNYKIEEKVILDKIPNCEIKYSGLDFKKDLDTVGGLADAVICQINIPMSGEVIDRLTNCKVISVYGAGYDKVDVGYAKQKGIKVTNVSSYCVDDVSDYVISAMYRYNKMLSGYNNGLKNGLWGAQAVERKIHRLSSQKLFIAGFGKIGREIAKKAKALGMSVMFFDPYVSEESADEMGVQKVSLEDGLASGDFLSLNMKLTGDTQKLITLKELKLMKPEAYLINASRGGVIEEDDLMKAVNEGIISGATLDVVSVEPPPENLEILHCNNIFVTPHISYLSEDSLNELQRSAAENAVGILTGETVRDIVNN